MFALSPSLDRDQLALHYARHRRVRVKAFLAGDGARVLASTVLAETRWMRLIRSGTQTYELSRADYAAFPQANRDKIALMIADEAATGFRFAFETVRIDDDAGLRAADASPLARFAEFMNSASVFEFVRGVTAVSDITFADAQATAYHRGDVLSRHDDDVAGKHRRAAYVLGLTDGWQSQWGGALTFHDAVGDTALKPVFGALDIFAVPQPHSVAPIAPGAEAARHAVTGWFRAHDVAGHSRSFDASTASL